MDPLPRQSPRYRTPVSVFTRALTILSTRGGRSHTPPGVKNLLTPLPRKESNKIPSSFVHSNSFTGYWVSGLQSRLGRSTPKDTLQNTLGETSGSLSQSPGTHIDRPHLLNPDRIIKGRCGSDFPVSGPHLRPPTTRDFSETSDRDPFQSQ